MRVIQVWAMLLVGLLLVGCGTQRPVVTDHDTAYDFSALRTFSVADSRQSAEDAILISPFTISHLHHVIGNELSERYQRAREGAVPDFVVSYHIVLEERLEVRTYDHRYGFGYYGFGPRHRFYSPYPYFYAPGPAPRVFRQGTLIVDIVDGNTKNPIWRGISSHRLRDGLTPQQQREILSAAVTEILGNFPPVN